MGEIAVFAIAVAIRLAVAWSIPVPSNDGPHYLDMAQAFARGDLHAAFSCIFHPGFSLMVAPFVAIGADPFFVSKVLGAVLGGMTAIFVLRAARRLSPEGGFVCAGALSAMSFLLVRFPADAYSENAYLPLLAAAVWLALERRALASAALIGLAYWVRPEALCALPLPLLLTRRSRGLAALVVGGLIASVYPVVRALVLGSFAFTPKFEFMRPLGPLASPTSVDAAAAFVQNLVRVPVVALPALDWVGFPLAMIGLVLLVRRQPRVAFAVVLAIVLGWGAMCWFQVKPRFIAGQAPLLLPLVALSTRRRWLTVVAVLGLAGAGVRLVGDVLDPPRMEKRAEAELGRWLARQGVRPGELVTDMPRVAWYAGAHPPPPVIWTPARLVARLEDRSGDTRVRWVVLGAKRAGRERVVAATRWLQRIELPRSVAHLRGADRLLLARRR